MKAILNQNESWTVSFYDAFTPDTCVYKGIEQAASCRFGGMIAESLVSMIPTIVFCVMINLFPLFMSKAIVLLGKPAISQNKDIEYRFIFVFLILIQGILQLIFPNMLNVQ